MRAVVLHSGGMDSSTCLKLAVNEHGAEHVTALSFDYGQRHVTELQAAADICAAWGVQRHTLDLTLLKQITHSALTDPSIAIQQHTNAAPNTLVVGRNGLMIHLGGIFANHIGADEMWLGVIGEATANSGYRDCSKRYMDLQQEIIRLDLDNPSFTIRTPLVHMTKADTTRLADRLGILEFLIHHTVTCYEGIRGTGCGRCPACQLRQEGLQHYRDEHAASC